MVTQDKQGYYRVTALVSKDLAADITEAADCPDRSESQLIREALRQRLQELQDD
jgi:predicted transcriptional regulator